MYGSEGFSYYETDELRRKNKKHGYCQICHIRPNLQSTRFGDGGRTTGSWNIDSDDDKKEYDNFCRALWRHYYDTKRNTNHIKNKLKIEGCIDDPMIIVFCNLCRAFSKVLTLGIGYINYESFIEDIYFCGGMIGDQYHSRRFCDFLLLQFFNVRLDDIATAIHTVLPATGCMSPLSLTSDKSTDSAGTHEEQCISYIDPDDGIKVVDEIAVVHISNDVNDITTTGTADGLSESWCKSLRRIRASDERLQYGLVSVSQDAEYKIKGVQDAFIVKIKSDVCYALVDPAHDVEKIFDKIRDQFLSYFIHIKCVNIIHSWFGTKTKLQIKKKTKETKKDKKLHGLNPFVDTRFVAYARTAYENRSYHHKSIDIIGRDQYKSESKPARKKNIELSRIINNSKWYNIKEAFLSDIKIWAQNVSKYFQSTLNMYWYMVYFSDVIMDQLDRILNAMEKLKKSNDKTTLIPIELKLDFPALFAIKNVNMKDKEIIIDNIKLNNMYITKYDNDHCLYCGIGWVRGRMIKCDGCSVFVHIDCIKPEKSNLNITYFIHYACILCLNNGNAKFINNASNISPTKRKKGRRTNKNAPPHTKLINKADIIHFDIINEFQDDMKYNLDDDKLPDYSKAIKINKRSNNTDYKLIKLSNDQLISRLRDEFIVFVELYRYFWKKRIAQKIMDDFKYAYNIYNFRYLHDQCTQIMVLLKRNKKKNKQKYLEDLEKVKEIKSDILSKGISELKKLCKIYNDGIKGLRYNGNSMINTENIDSKLVIYRKRLIQWTISGNFNREYIGFKKYYKNKYGHDHYPKSAEYARISIKRHGIYHGVEDIIKLMTVYYVANAPQPATESKQKLLMNRDINRYHTDRAKVEMESVSTGGLSKHHNNEQMVMKTALKCIHSGKNPFVQSSIKLISPVMDRRCNATKPYQSKIPDIDFDA